MTQGAALVHRSDVIEQNGRPWGAITVFLADDSVIIRDGVSAMLARDPDVEVVGVAEDYDALVAGAEAANPDVIVSDIRMPPHFQREGIDACKEIRKRHPGTGVVILSQYDDPDYAVSLLAEGVGRLRLPAEGPHRRGRPARAGRSARSPPAARCSTR